MKNSLDYPIGVGDFDDDFKTDRKVLLTISKKHKSAEKYFIAAEICQNAYSNCNCCPLAAETHCEELLVRNLLSIIREQDKMIKVLQNGGNIDVHTD